MFYFGGTALSRLRVVNTIRTKGPFFGEPTGLLLPVPPEVFAQILRGGNLLSFTIKAYWEGTGSKIRDSYHMLHFKLDS